MSLPPLSDLKSVMAMAAFNRSCVRELYRDYTAPALEGLLTELTFLVEGCNGGHQIDCYALGGLQRIYSGSYEGIEKLCQTYVLAARVTGTHSLSHMAIVQNHLGLVLDEGAAIETYHDVIVADRRESYVIKGAFDDPSRAVKRLKKELVGFYNQCFRDRKDACYCPPDKIMDKAAQIIRQHDHLLLQLPGIEAIPMVPIPRAGLLRRLFTP